MGRKIFVLEVGRPVIEDVRAQLGYRVQVQKIQDRIFVRGVAP
jgi:hypothetical protein